IGYEINDLMQDYIGLIGAILVMAFILIFYLVVRVKLTPELVADAFKKSKKQLASEFISDEPNANIDIETNNDQDNSNSVTEGFTTTTPTPSEKTILKPDVEVDVEMEVEETLDEEEELENLSNKLVKDFGKFDPRLELSNYKFPSIDLLREYTAGGGITINQEELDENKNRIVETLNNYKIGIANIKATIGPTVTLYEIVPDAGIRISKIKNLEDDI